jgi:hypothetical protein
MSDIPDDDEFEPPKAPVRRTRGCLWAFLFVSALIIVVELLSVRYLGSSANETFSMIGSRVEGR